MPGDEDYRLFLLETGEVEDNYKQKLYKRGWHKSETRFRLMLKSARYERARKRWKKDPSSITLFGKRFDRGMLGNLIDFTEERHFADVEDFVDLFLSHSAPQMEIDEDDNITAIDPRLSKFPIADNRRYADPDYVSKKKKKRRKRKKKDKPYRPLDNRIELVVREKMLKKLTRNINQPIQGLMNVLVCRYINMLTDMGLSMESLKWEDMLVILKGDYGHKFIRDLRDKLWFEFDKLFGESILNLEPLHFFARRDPIRERPDMSFVPPSHNMMRIPFDEYKNFWTLIDTPVDWTDQCWLWEGKIFTSGPLELYGHHHFQDKVHELAHETVWEMYHGAMDPDTFLHHKCGNRRCVNPNHLIVSPYSAEATLHLVKVKLE